MTALDFNAQRILEVIVRAPNSALDELVLERPDLTWNQVFLVIDRLSREGVINVLSKAPGIYTIHLANTPEPAAEHHVGA